MVDDLKTSTAIAVVAASAPDADSISTTLAALYARSPDRIDAVLQRHGTIRGLLRRTNEGLIELGRQLIEQRRDIKPGYWQPYLRNVLGISQPSAFQAVRAVESFGALPGNILANFHRHAIYLLFGPGVSEARAEAIKRAEAGELITKTVVQKLIASTSAAVGPMASDEPDSELSKDPQPARDTPEPAATETAATPPKPSKPRPPKATKPQASTEPKPPVSRMIDPLEIDRLIGQKAKRIKAIAKRLGHPQITVDIIQLADEIQVQIAKWTTEGPAASPNSEALAAE